MFAALQGKLPGLVAKKHVMSMEYLRASSVLSDPGSLYTGPKLHWPLRLKDVLRIGMGMFICIMVAVTFSIGSIN